MVETTLHAVPSAAENNDADDVTFANQRHAEQGHDNQQRPVSAKILFVRAHGPALQVVEGADLIFPKDFEAPTMQTAQDLDRRTGIHPQHERWRILPTETHLA